MNSILIIDSNIFEGLDLVYDSSVPFSNRLYGDFDVEIRRIRLRAPISKIIVQPLFYVRNMVPALCFQAAMKLWVVRFRIIILIRFFFSKS